MTNAMNNNNLTECNKSISKGNNFKIVEIEGGRGTNAKALLDHLSDCHADMYQRLHCYTIFDTSPTLHELQRKVLIGGSYSRHADKVKLVNVDMMDVAEGK